jgi:hypothetical protein
MLVIGRLVIVFLLPLMPEARLLRCEAGDHCTAIAGA